MLNVFVLHLQLCKHTCILQTRQLRSVLLWNELVKQAIFMIVTESTLHIGTQPVISAFFVCGVRVGLNCLFYSPILHVYKYSKQVFECLTI